MSNQFGEGVNAKSRLVTKETFDQKDVVDYFETVSPNMSAALTIRSMLITPGTLENDLDPSSLG